MTEPRGTQIKNLPRVNTFDGSDVIVKQKTLQNNIQTQGVSMSDLMNYTGQQLSIPQILLDIADIQQQITTIIQKSDVADIVNCYDNEGDTSKTDIVHYDTTTLTNNDIVEVLNDETHSNSVSYYKYNSNTGTFTYIGSLAPYYNKTEIDDKILLINNDLLKLFSYGNFALWDATKTYLQNAIVLKNNTYWRSLQDGNINHDPEEVGSLYWKAFDIINDYSNDLFTATIDNTNRTITLSGRTPQANQWLASLTSNDITTGFSLRIIMSGSNTGGAVPYTLIFNSNLSKRLVINYCNSNDNEPYCSRMLMDKVRYDITYRGSAFVVDDYINVLQVKQGVSNGIHYEVKNDGICLQFQEANANTSGGSNITFPIAYSSSPTVLVTARSGKQTTSTRSSWDRGSNTTGFTIGQGENIECSWEAMGEVDLSLL